VRPLPPVDSYDIAAGVRADVQRERSSVEFVDDEPQYPTGADGNVITPAHADALDAMSKPSYRPRLSLALVRAAQAVRVAVADALDPQPLLAAETSRVEAPPVEDRAPPDVLLRAHAITAHAPPVRAFDDLLAVRTRTA
jgi:hypothetical protein